MPKLLWRDLVGQERVKETVAKALETDSLGHAYLFCGEPGGGKLQAALELSMALLCTGTKQVPCYACDSCRQARNHTHPDLHLVVPVCLEKQHRKDGQLTEEGWEYLDEICKMRIADPYVIEEHKGIAGIPVEWVREVNHSILRGAVKQRRNVAIICGIDVMNKESANAMLKTLEEPPENTVIILCTERPYAVLPTIVSRCQLMRFGYIPAEQMAAALRTRYGEERGEARITNAVRCAEGSLGKALQLMEQPLEEFLHDAQSLLELCRENDWHDIAPRLEQVVHDKLDFGREYGAAERILTYVVYVVRDGFLGSLGVSEKYIRREFASDIVRSSALDPSRAAAIVDACQGAVSAVRARGNVQMVLVTFLMKVMEILHGQEQPSG